jgi:hypothetical protein
MELNEKYIHAIEGQQELFSRVHDSNYRLQDKAMTILQSSSVIIGLVAAGKLAGQQSVTSSLVQILLFFITVLFVIIVGLCILAWRPRPQPVPGQFDWDKIFQKHIYADDESDLKQTLSDHVAAIKDANSENAYLSRLVNRACVCLAVQALFLMIMLLA